MKKQFLFFGLFILFFGCKTAVPVPEQTQQTDNLQPSWADFTIAFGSCNRTDIDNLLWDDVAQTKPNVWIWGGDNIYADTDNMQKLEAMYTVQSRLQSYDSLRNIANIIGTWDDHDYGLNDGGVEFKAKQGSQQAFLDFMGVPKDSPSRTQEGIYAVHHFPTEKGTVSVFVLDTRYFRTAITPDTETSKRLKPNAYGEGTILGEAQWKWLAEELHASNADFNIIVSSIQVLSNEHGFECWGNFPHEVDRLESLIADSKAKAVLVVSGDRHISEFSKTTVDGMPYPLIDFTSSGLTHAYRGFKGEPNPYRVGEVVFTESFGTLQFNFQQKKVRFKMLGDEGVLLGSLEQQY